MKFFTFVMLMLTSFSSVFSLAYSEDLPAKKGVLRVRFAAWPKALNYLNASDVYTGTLMQLTHARLLASNHETWKLIPQIAERWEESKDFKTLTFYINPKATFVSGAPVTADDVKFTYELIYDVKRCITCEPIRSYIGPFEKFEVIDRLTFRVVMQKVDYLNAARFSSAPILERKVYEKGDFNRDYQRKLDGAGPYAYDAKESTMRGKIVLRLREDNWLNVYPNFQKEFNFKKIIFKYIDDEAVAFEAFKRKDLDIMYFDVTTLRFWDRVNQAPFTNPDMVRVEAAKIVPWSWGGIALNMRQGPTSDIRFRKALQFLLNRDMIVSKILKGHQTPLAGPFPKGTATSANLPPIPFDPAQAKALLKEAGFVKADDTGILYREIPKDGKSVRERASLTVMYGTKAHDQWMTIWKDDAKKYGVEVIPKLTDWSAATKLVDDLKFEGFVIGWAGDPEPEPRQLWHSSGAMEKGSSNMPGFADKEADRLMELAPATADADQRNAMYRELEKRIIEAQPYVFRWSQTKHYAAYWKDKVNPGSHPFLKFSGDDHRDIFFTHWTSTKE